MSKSYKIRVVMADIHAFPKQDDLSSLVLSRGSAVQSGPVPWLLSDEQLVRNKKDPFFWDTVRKSERWQMIVAPTLHPQYPMIAIPPACLSEKEYDSDDQLCMIESVSQSNTVSIVRVSTSMCPCNIAARSLQGLAKELDKTEDFLMENRYGLIMKYTGPMFEERFTLL